MTFARDYCGLHQAKQSPPSKWRSLSGKEQTDELFDKKIIERMEQELYEQVCAPAIRQAYEAGKRYRDIRDTVRQEWKPCEWKSSAIGLLVPLGGWQGSGIIAAPPPGVGPSASPGGAFPTPARLTPRCGD